MMKKDIEPLELNCFYHIYNKGINGAQIFFSHANYLYFLKCVSEKTASVAGIYSYCLLQGHFHILIKTKSEEDIRAVFAEKQDVNKVISQQFSNAFNSYSQAINKRFGRTGKLFELPFRRKKIKSEQQLIKSVLHINKNPAKHHVTEDFLNYPYSSVADILSSTALTAEYHEVIALFNGVENFKKSLSEFQT